MRKDEIILNETELEKNENGGIYRFQIKIPSSVGWIEYVRMTLEDGGYTKEIPMLFIENRDGYSIFETTMDLETRALYKYYYKYNVHGREYFVTDRKTKSHIEYDEKIKMSVNFNVPDWANGAIMYHIFVDRFRRGSKFAMEPMKRRVIHKSWDEDVVLGDNPDVYHYDSDEEVWNVDFFGGDLKGIEEALDYIESLGVSIIYLSPIVFSQSTHRYDAADYNKVDPYAGCNDDLKHLCDAAHKRGMHVILDVVPNHVGDESKYFDRHGDYRTGNKHEDGAFNNPESKYHDLFRYRYDHGYEENCFWWDIGTMPENNSSGKVWEEIICGREGALATYFSLGIDGIRIDVPENVDDKGILNINKTCYLYNPNPLIVGEMWELATRKDRPYLTPDRMQTVMNYPLMDGLVRYFKYHDVTKLAYIIRDIKAEYPKETEYILMNSTSTHDISRIITLLARRRFDAYDKYKDLKPELKRMIFDALRDIGYREEDVYALFFGEMEISLELYHKLMWRLGEKGVPVQTVNYLKSIFHYTPFKPKEFAKDIDEDVKGDLEFTKNYVLTEREYKDTKDVLEAYLFFLYSWPGIVSIFYGDEVGLQGLNNLANRRPYPYGKEDKELLEYFRMLGRYRKSQPFLRKADSNIIELRSDLVTFERIKNDEKLFVAVNNSREDKEIYIPEEYRDGKKILTLKKSNKEILHPYGGIVIKK